MATRYRLVEQPWDRNLPFAVEQDQGGLWVCIFSSGCREEANEWLDAWLAGPKVLREAEA